MIAPPPPSRTRLAKGAVALLMGSALNHFGDRLLGVKIELFRGLQGFDGPWILDVFGVPFLVGILVAVIFGLGGKWLCYFPPLIVRIISYAEISYISGAPPGTSLIPLGWWGFFVILVIEAAAIGGVIGEIVVKSTYGRQPIPVPVAEAAPAPPGHGQDLAA
jgi:hypothetical protein